MKKKILRIINSLNPKYGGPAVAIIDSSVELINNGHEVDILTNDPENSNFHKIKKIKVINLGSGIGNYSFNYKLFLWLIKNKNKYDNFIIHGIWEFHTLIARILLKKKYFVFIHGQLDPFFEKQFFKKIKKKIYWFLFEKKNLIFSKSILLTTQEEKRLLNKTYVNTDKIKKKVIGYGIKKKILNIKKLKSDFLKNYPLLKKKFFFLYLGRFHEKKGCDILIESIDQLSKKNINVNLLMVGPDNDYKNYLKKIVKKKRLHKQIIWSKALSGNLKWGAILSSRAMVLASHGENFGVSIAESLSCSKPVIITNKVNIYKSIKNFNAGIVSKNNSSSFEKSISSFLKMNSFELKKMSINANKCFNQNFNISVNIKILEKLLT
jgi:glycosyltransferase involved in cell wall biosynthesis